MSADSGAVREASGHQGSSGNETVRPQYDPVDESGADPDEAAGTDGTTASDVYAGANRAIIPDPRVMPNQGAAVDIDMATHRDRGAENRTRADDGPDPTSYIAGKMRGGVNKGRELKPHLFHLDDVAAPRRVADSGHRPMRCSQ